MKCHGAHDVPRMQSHRLRLAGGSVERYHEVLANSNTTEQDPVTLEKHQRLHYVVPITNIIHGYAYLRPVWHLRQTFLSKSVHAYNV